MIRTLTTLMRGRVLMLISACVILAMTSSCGSARRLPRHIEICPPPPFEPCRSTGYQRTLQDSVDESLFETKPVRGANGFTHEYAMAWRADSLVDLVTESEKRGVIRSATVVMYDSVHVNGKREYSVQGDIGLSSSGATEMVTLYGFGSTTADADIMSVERGRCTPPAGLIQSGTWDGHPSLDAEGRVMFFASDREGGFGGLDIWVTVRDSMGHWMKPLNAGPSINTACDELTPFLTFDGRRLLFSSRGHATAGGYDIFVCDVLSLPASKEDSVTVQRHFAAARNMGPTVNSAADELGPSTNTVEEDLLYFSSNRHSVYDFDMYVRRRPLRARPSLRSTVSLKADPSRAGLPDTVEVSGRVIDELQRAIVNAEVTAREVNGDSVIARTTTDTAGEYRLRVGSDRSVDIVAQSSRGFFDSYRFDPTAVDSVPQPHAFVVPEVLELRINFPSDEDKVPYRNLLDTNGVETDLAWERAMDRIADNLKRFVQPSTRIQLVGHTDRNGTTAYNDALGRRRVTFVVDELQKRGLPRIMFDIRSAGERELLKRRNAESDEEYDKRNRRVELTKVSR